MKNTIIIDAADKKARMDLLYGIFFEDISHAADGGLYGELVQNRAFEYCAVDNPEYHGLTAWEKIGRETQVVLQVETGCPVNANNPHYLGMDIKREGCEAGIQNLGYNCGIPFRKGEKYYFSCYVKREQDLNRPLTVSFRGKDGTVYVQKQFTAGMEWTKAELEIRSPATDFEGRLAVTASGRGKIYLDFVSLFPADTFMGRRNGLRRDLADLIAGLKPRFMRFPGGCLVHVGALDEHARDGQYRWKNTIGPVEGRPSRKNVNYNQTLGLGYLEYFQFCEDIGARPIPVFSAGYDPHTHRAVPLERMQPWVEDVLDLIAFATQGPESGWGRKRMELGHEAPFPLDTVAVGNEEEGEEFFERYAVIHQAVKKKYPWIKIINTAGPCAEGEAWERGWRSAGEWGSDYVDEHYYQTPEWFLGNHHRYDSYSEKGAGVFLGEYASWGNSWRNALAEASYMIGLERNADVVKMACYAPLLCNAGYVGWDPNLIWFDNHQSFGTVNYYVQKLFMNHQGDVQLGLRYEEKEPEEVWSRYPGQIRGGVQLEAMGSRIAAADFLVKKADSSERLGLKDFVLMPGEKGEVLGEVVWQDYDISFRLEEQEQEGESEGFRLLFGIQDEGSCYCWDCGLAGNTLSLLLEQNGGRHSCLTQHSIKLERGRACQMLVQVRGRKITTFVDGVKCQETESRPVSVKPLYVSAALDESASDVIVKAVNVRNQPKQVKIVLENGCYGNVEIHMMQSGDLDTANSFEQPVKLVPLESMMKMEGNSLEYTFEPRSVTILRFKKK